MSKTLQTVGWIAAGLVAYNIFNKVVALKSAKFFPDKIVSLDWVGINPVIGVSLLVQNTSFSSATVYSMSGQVLANNYWIGSVYSFTPQLIAPNAQSRIVVYLRLSWMGVVQNIVSAFESGINGAEFDLDGIANVDSFPVPINLKFKVGV